LPPEPLTDLALEHPAPDELEVSVFGPGYGEAIAVHIGEGRWLTVDSCRNRRTGRPAALEYLLALGVDVSSDVVLVAATHWHDDHIAGLAQVVEECAGAAFACPASLEAGEFLRLVKASSVRAAVVRTGVAEFGDIVDGLAAQGRGAPTFGKSHTVLHRAASCEVEALSPSDAAVLQAMAEIAGLLPQEDSGKKRVVPPPSNRASMAIQVIVGERSLLLGADLQEVGVGVAGWTEIVNSPVRKPVKSELYKVAHHGSHNADHGKIWSELLVPGPVAVLTPFSKGRSPLPSTGDRTRIRGRTATSYLTSGRGAGRIKRDGHTEKMLRGRSSTITRAEGPTGHVRARTAIGVPAADWVIELSEVAVQL
jgi:hypothetical protein